MVNLSPKLRFPEFSGNWKSKKLEEVGSVINGLTYSPDDIHDDGVLVLRSSNVKENQLSFNDNVYVNTDNYNPVRENDILICVRNGSRNLIGKNALITKEAEGVAFGAFMSVYRSELNKFVFQLFATDTYYKIIQENLGATINSINNSDLKKFEFFFPLKEEQDKIADFLYLVDNKINKLTKKKVLLEQYKKGIMQKIFNQEIRFKDDNGNDYPEWNEKTLDDIATINMGQSPSSNSYNFDGNGLMLIQGNADIKERKTNPRQWTSQPTKKCEIGDIILTVRAPVGFVSKSIHEACIGRGVCSIKSKGKNNNEFVYQFLLYFEDKWGKLEQGSTFTAVSGSEIKSILLEVPSFQEQDNIATFLSSIDRKINSVNIQLEGTKEFKRGLLQLMFV
jgi:type I restriction enzyme S subunit